MILRRLSRRIGAISPQTEAQFRLISLAQLKALSEALLDFASLVDLDAWLKSN